MGWILAVNAGSSSLKIAAFTADASPLASRAIPGVDVATLPEDRIREEVQALAEEAGLTGPPDATGHRIVHGLELDAPCELTDDICTHLEKAGEFAPLHNPPALRVAALCQSAFPEARHVACFDTAFHAHNPAEAVTFPLPRSYRDQGIRRYGFHGLSYAALVRRFPAIVGHPLPDRCLLFHLGAGASLAAVRNGKGVATTMGFSPMDGLVMATRAGSMDPGVILRLMRQGMDADGIETLLNRESGLSALGGSPSMKDLTESDREEARFAVDHFTYWLCRHAGSMIAAMGGLDAMVFTGGIGENAKTLRDEVIGRLAWAGATAETTWVIPADEEGEIARSVRDLIWV